MESELAVETKREIELTIKATIEIRQKLIVKEETTSSATVLKKLGKRKSLLSISNVYKKNKFLLVKSRLKLCKSSC
jgi:hypothetical protein